MIVDTHAHIYHGDEDRYPMTKEPFRPVPGVGTIEHLRREAEENGVKYVVLVQTGSAYRWDNRLLADTARDNAPWTVGVCTLDPAGDDSPDELARLGAGRHRRWRRRRWMAGRRVRCAMRSRPTRSCALPQGRPSRCKCPVRDDRRKIEVGWANKT